MALKRAAKARGVSYAELKSFKGGKRRQFHDDISVIVHFFNYEKMQRNTRDSSSLSIKSGDIFKDEQIGQAESDIEMEKTPI